MIPAGAEFQSSDPASEAIVWRGKASTHEECEAAVTMAREAQREWGASSTENRQSILKKYAGALERRSEALATDISRENGKPLWEARAEVAGMIGKVALSIRAQDERAAERSEKTGFGSATLRHRPHGVFAVLGPFNFPGHLPNGHIVPALLAGNAVVFKPSEKTPSIGEHFAAALKEAGLPDGLFGLVQGARETGEALVDQNIDGVLFTGSSNVGASLRKRLASRPHVILALELGGNNPIVAWDGNVEAAAAVIAESAFVSGGQRCSCARRLILPNGKWGDRVVDHVIDLAERLVVGPWNSEPEPFMGPLIDAEAAAGALRAQARLIELGASPKLALDRRSDLGQAFLSPGIIDVTNIDVPDDEIFAPLLQITRVADWSDAIRAANHTKFGLAAGLISEDDELWDAFQNEVRVGVVNRNRPTTGASGAMPFGGLGESGNHRPSAWYAADYASYPVASQEATEATNSGSLLRVRGDLHI